MNTCNNADHDTWLVGFVMGSIVLIIGIGIILGALRVYSDGLLFGFTMVAVGLNMVGWNVVHNLRVIKWRNQERNISRRKSVRGRVK